MQCRMPKKTASPGREDQARRGDERRRRGDNREPPPETARVEPVAMGERQRNADQGQKRARHHMRQEPQRRRERQIGRNKTKVGEVPAQVVGAMPRIATPRAQSMASTRPRRSPALPPSFTTPRLQATRRRERIRPRIRPGRSSARGRRRRAIRSTSSPPGRRTVPLRSISPSARRGDEGRAGGRAAGERQADAALPDARLESSRAMISANETLAFSGNIGWSSISGAELCRIDAREIGDEEDRMRIAHVDGRGRPSPLGGRRHRAKGRRAACRRPHARAGFRPAEPRRAHVDAIGPRAEALAGEDAGLGLDLDALRPPSSRHSRSATQRVAVAAGAG